MTVDTVKEQSEEQTKLKWYQFSQPLVWRNVIGLFLLHVFAIYTPFLKPDIRTWIWGYVLGYMGGIAVTAGAHRLWTHRTYKAKLPLRIYLMLTYLIAGQYSLVQWARDHRLHHKQSDTDGDPHNANRGFFYSHCGWLMMKRHPESKRLGKAIDVSDLMRDPVVAFHQKYFVPLFTLFFIVLPVVVPPLCWGESWKASIIGMLSLRYIIQLHCVWTINSVTHFFGYKPYNKNIRAVQNKFVGMTMMGEGWHNYHHVFPWDYRASRHEMLSNAGATFIELCEWLGLASDLKTASPGLVSRVMARTNGDSRIEAPNLDKLADAIEEPAAPKTFWKNVASPKEDIPVAC